MDNPFLKVRIRNKYHIVSFDDVNKMASQMVWIGEQKVFIRIMTQTLLAELVSMLFLASIINS